MSLSQEQTKPGIYAPGSLPLFDMDQSWRSTNNWDGSPSITVEEVESTLYSVQHLSQRGPRVAVANEAELEQVLVGSWMGSLRNRDNRFKHALDAVHALDSNLLSLPRDRDELLELSERMRSRIAEIRLEDGLERVAWLGSIVSVKSDIWAQVRARRNGQNRDDLFLARLRGLIPIEQDGSVKARPVVSGKDGNLGIASGSRLLYVQLPREEGVTKRRQT